jgi:hypothetical protein
MKTVNSMELKKYRILMITTGFAPYEFSEALVNSKLVLALREYGHDVDVITRESNQTYYIGWSDLWSPMKENVHFVPELKVGRIKRILQLANSLFFFKYPVYGIRWGYEVYKLACALNKRKPYDILLTRMPSMIPHLIGLKLHKKIGICWFANWNDPTDNIRPLRNDRNPIKSIINNILVKDVFFHTNLNTYPSRELYDHFNKYIIKDNNSHVEIIPHIGIDFRSKSDFSTNQKILTICHAGTIWPDINTQILIRALAKLKYKDKIEFRFHVFGFVNEEFLHEIKTNMIEDDVECHGSLSYLSIMNELLKYDVLLLLEAQYERGILLLSKLSDYASTHKPIFCISPKEGVIADYINNYGGGLVADNTNFQSVYVGLKRMHKAFEQNWHSSDILLSDKLFEQFMPERVVAKYEQLFKASETTALYETTAL